MSEVQITESELQAYTDGRLDAERGAAVEAWLAARPDQAERIAEYRRIAEELRSAEPEPTRRCPGSRSPASTSATGPI